MLIVQKINGLIILIVSLLGMLFSGSAFALHFDSRPITPIPTNPIPSPLEAQKIALGKQLFNDKRLSKYNNLACATCHDLHTGGTHPNAKGTINIPSIFNTQYNFKQFWDGRANSLEEAIKLSLFDPKGMNFNPKTDLPKLSKNKSYKTNLNTEEIISALASYLRTLNTPNAPFDQYLSGNTKALTDSQQKGYALFKSYGCISCHQGILVGGNLMQKFGIYNDYFITKQKIQDIDLGYYHVTKNPNDKFVFKVPSLRNIALTGPYLHDGSIDNLNEVIEKMAIYQLGRPITQQDVQLIAQFLYTLTGQIPEK